MTVIVRYPTLATDLYHLQSPTPLQGHVIAGHFNLPLAKQLQWTDQQQQHWIHYCSGHQIFPEFPSLAMVYAGHQFGQWAGQLGDGRGLLIAQMQDISGNCIDLHLKGSGKTPFSRMGDGRAVLRSVIREYLAGHTLNALGVSSSNAIGFTTSDEYVRRERFERGAMLLRTSDCHIRLGHFEWIAHYRPTLLQEFTQKCIEWHYPDCLKEEIPVLAFVKNVIKNTAKMIAQWQLVGFTHGVMNTDNLNITGSTLDFGPFAFMERFRPNYISNHSDHTGRYTYQKQPSIAHWNLWTWLNTLTPLAPKGMDKAHFQQYLLQALDTFETEFLAHYQQGLAYKMGLPDFHHDSFECGLQFLHILASEQLDYTQSFQYLQQQHFHELRQQCLDTRQFDEFLARYHHIREHQDTTALYQIMTHHNPYYILRNHMAQRAIEYAEQLDFSEVDRLFQLLTHPYQKQAKLERSDDLAPLPKGVPEIMVSCSS